MVLNYEGVDNIDLQFELRFNIQPKNSEELPQYMNLGNCSPVGFVMKQYNGFVYETIPNTVYMKLKALETAHLNPGTLIMAGSL